MAKKEKKWTEKEAKKREIQRWYTELENLVPKETYKEGEETFDEQYSKILNRIHELEKDDVKRDKVSPNTCIAAGASIFSVLVIIVYEGFGNIIHTKSAMPFIPKIKF